MPVKRVCYYSVVDTGSVSKPEIAQSLRRRESNPWHVLQLIRFRRHSQSQVLEGPTSMVPSTAQSAPRSLCWIWLTRTFQPCFVPVWPAMNARYCTYGSTESSLRGRAAPRRRFLQFKWPWYSSCTHDFATSVITVARQRLLLG